MILQNTPNKPLRPRIGPGPANRSVDGHPAEQPSAGIVEWLLGSRAAISRQVDHRHKQQQQYSRSQDTAGGAAIIASHSTSSEAREASGEEGGAATMNLCGV